MTRPRSIFCGRRPVDFHHVTGRSAPDGEYLDPALVVALCRKHHSREHVVLTDLDLEWPPEGGALLAHRLRRARAFVDRSATFRRPLVLDPVVQAALAALIGEAAEMAA